MTREEGENWLINITADIGKVEHQELLKKAVIDAVKNAAVVVAWDDEADEYDVADIAIKATKRSVIESIEELPFAQPEIIRCKDCKYWCINKRLDIPWCRNLHIDRGTDDFCSNAERREEGDG